MPEEISPIWIAACAHRLQRHWRSVDHRELELVAAEIWARHEVRALEPAAAAAGWLKSIEVGVVRHAHAHDLVAIAFFGLVAAAPNFCVKKA